VGIDLGDFLLMFEQSLWSGVTVGCIYALVALGFTLIYKVSHVVNVAHGEFLMLGGLTFYSFVLSLQFPLPLAVLLATLVGGFAGWLMVNVAIFPLKNPSILMLITITLAFGEMLKGIAYMIWGTDFYGIPTIVQGTSVQIFAANIHPQSFVIIGITLVVYIALMLLTKFTLFGKSFIAVAVEPYAAGLIGIHVKRLTTFVFIFGGLLGALAGVLAGPLTTMSFVQGSMLGIKAMIGALLGGLGNFTGALVGSIVLGLLESMGAGFISSLYKDIFAFVILLVILLINPGKVLAQLKSLRNGKRLKHFSVQLEKRGEKNETI
jgi:branched-chain amino acid transport system permease protein